VAPATTRRAADDEWLLLRARVEELGRCLDQVADYDAAAPRPAPGRPSGRPERLPGGGGAGRHRAWCGGAGGAGWGCRTPGASGSGRIPVGEALAGKG
jgi:hypothetical protein